MKKILLGISMMMLSAVGMNVMAQNNQNVCPVGKECAKEAKTCPKKECTKECTKECPKKECTKECAKECKKDRKNCAKAECRDSKGCPVKAVCAERQCAANPCKGDSAFCRAGKAVCNDGRRVCAKGDSTRCSADRRGGHHGKAFGKGRKGGNMRADLFDGIELTAEQKGKLQELDRNMAKERKEMSQAMKEKKGEAREEVSKLRKQAHEKYEAGVKEILTAEQYAKYELNRKEMRFKAGAKGEMRRMKSDFRNARQTAIEKVDRIEKKN